MTQRSVHATHVEAIRYAALLAEMVRIMDWISVVLISGISLIALASKPTAISALFDVTLISLSILSLTKHRRTVCLALSFLLIAAVLYHAVLRITGQAECGCFGTRPVPQVAVVGWLLAMLGTTYARLRFRPFMLMSCVSTGAILSTVLAAHVYIGHGSVAENVEFDRIIAKLDKDRLTDRFFILDMECKTCRELVERLCDGTKNSSVSVVLIASEPQLWEPMVRERDIQLLQKLEWNYCAPAEGFLSDRRIRCMGNLDSVASQFH